MHERLRKIFDTFNVQLIASHTKYLFTTICKKQDPIPTSLLSGLYEIPLQVNNDLLIFYIGLTKRTLFERIKEHKHYVRFNNSPQSYLHYFLRIILRKLVLEMLKVIQGILIPLKPSQEN